MSGTSWKRFEGRVVDGRYHLDRLLGVGAFGGVFRADEVVRDRLIRTLALKLISPHPTVKAEDQIDELAVSVRLDHPALLRCFSAGQCDLDGEDLLYLVAELGEETLDRRLSGGPMAPADSLSMARSLAAALGYLHGPSIGMVHRDVKPANVLRVHDRWKLSDFGMLRSYAPGGAAGAALGTPEYAPPESYDGCVTPAWDIWSFGVVLAETLTGRLPFTAASPEGFRDAVRRHDPDLVGLPSTFRPLVTGCLSRSPDSRWTAERVERALASMPIPVPTPDLLATDLPPQEIRRFIGHEGWIESLSYSGDGRTLLSGSRDGTARLWDAATGRELRRFDHGRRPVLAVALTPGGDRALTGGEESVVRIWDVESGLQVGGYSEHLSWVTSLDVSPDGDLAASGSWDQSVRLWDPVTGRTVHRFDGHQDWVTGVRFLPDGLRIVSGSWDDTVRVWDAEEGRTLHCFAAGVEDVTSVDVSPNPRFFVFTSEDETIRVWDVEHGAQVRRLAGHRGAVRSAAFSPDGLRIVSGGDDGRVVMWDLQSGRSIWRIEAHKRPVRCVAFSPEGRTVATGGHDGVIRLWG